jgi:hypothetical protein
MTNEERDLITRFIERVAGGPSAQPGGFAGSVPGTAPPPPPIDPEADALIDSLFKKYPEARYRITQMAFVQEHALAEASNRINRLQWELQNARAAQQQQQQPSQPSSPWGAGAGAGPQPQQSRGFFGNLFGGGSQPPQQQYQQPQPQYAAPPPPPAYAPGYQPGMFQRPGSGFLGSALSTAAGVAGGVVAGNALMNLFSGHHGGLGGDYGTAAGMAGPSTGVEEYINPPQSGGPWGSSQEASYEQGGAPKDDPASDPYANNQGGSWEQADNSGLDQQADNSGWDQASDDAGGGWTDTGGDDWNNA